MSRATPWTAAMLALFVAIPSSGCLRESATIEVNFPSDDHFQYAATIQVLAYELIDPTERCIPEVAARINMGNSEAGRIFDSRPVDPCTVYRDEIVFEDVPDERLAFVAFSRTAAGELLMGGCKEANAHDEAVRIPMSTSQFGAMYLALIATLPEPQCRSAQVQCDGTCTRGDGGL
jgi:hypothetical protein